MPFTKGDPNINREGRPKGKTIKERIKDWLEEHPDDMQAFIEHFIKENRDLAWRMLEGNPHQATDLTTAGKPIPLLNVLYNNNSDKEDSETPKEDKSSTGGDISE